MQARASALLLRLVDSLFASPLITIPMAQRILRATYPSAQRNVERLVKAGILQPVGETSYGKTFSSQAILELISEIPG
jgi:Fic family protein